MIIFEKGDTAKAFYELRKIDIVFTVDIYSLGISCVSSKILLTEKTYNIYFKGKYSSPAFLVKYYYKK